jgi:hypothetical protein
VTLSDVAIVGIGEGGAMLTNVVECPPEDVRGGMPVEVIFVDVDGGSLPVFRSAAG